MAGKITIRRIGSILPPLCLLFLLLVCIAAIWLSTLGFPAGLLRYAERQVAKQGIILQIDSLRLAPSQGLALRAEGVRLYTTAESPHPLLELGSVTAGMNVGRLATGELRPSIIRIEGGSLHLPVTDPEGKCMEISDISLAARMRGGSMLNLTSGRLKLQGIPIQVQGSIDTSLLTASEKHEPDKPLNLQDILTDNQNIINQIYRHIEAQNWQPEERPGLNVRLNLVQDFSIRLEGNIPKVDLGQFHFREASINLVYNKDGFAISPLRFKTIEPDTEAVFQGAYSPQNRQLSFNAESTAALLRMVRSLSHGPVQEYLSKFRHPDDNPPHVRMSGDIVFGENYHPEHIKLRGLLRQRELMVGGTKVNEVELSFFYNDGNFNVDRLELILPDGSLRGMASAENGVGQAQLMADLPVQKMLTLINELAPDTLELPQDLLLGERVSLHLHAKINTPAFSLGQTNWQGYVPRLHVMSAKLQTDDISYRGYKLNTPEIFIQIADIEHSRNFIPHSVGKIEISFKAQEAALPTGEAEVCTLQAPVIQLHLQGLCVGTNNLPDHVQQLTLSARVDAASLAGEEPSLSVGETVAELRMQDVESSGDLSGLSIARAELQAQLAELNAAKLHASRLELQVNDVCHLTPLSNNGQYLERGRLRLATEGLSHRDTSIGEAEFICELREHTIGHLTLSTKRAEDGQTGTLQATTDLQDPGSVALRDIHADLPADTLSVLLALLNIDNTETETPGRIELCGDCTLNRSPLGVRGGKFRLEIPEIVRTPHRQAPFRGRRIPIGLSATGTLTRAQNSTLDYNVTLSAKHETGSMDVVVKGNTSGHLRVNGSTTIRPDVIDALIDSKDAHSIIRDFRFPAGGHTVVSDIDTRIDYSAGLRIDSDCRVELFNTEFMLGAIEEAADGAERLRRDMGNNPYTLVRHAICRVGVLVRENCTTPTGATTADESIITISDVTMEYDNAPWLSKQGIKGGARFTKLQGNTIIIDIERSFVELRELSGTVYPAYSLGMFYDDLYSYLEDVHLPNPVQLQSPKCVFPIYSDCKRPMSGTIRVLSPSGAAFRFLGTTIPMDDFSGFIYLTDDYVLLDRLNAKTWQGVLDASVKIGISGRRTSFDGYVNAQCMNLKDIAAAYDSKQENALCNGEVRFRASSPALKDIRAYGRVDIEDGNLMTLSLFHPVSELISDLPEHFTRLEKEAAGATGKTKTEPGFFSRVFTGIFRGIGRAVGTTGGQLTETASYIPGMNHIIAYDLQEAHASFDIINGHLITRGMKAKGYNLNVQLNLDLNLDTMYLNGNLWPRISSLPSILLAPLTFLSDFMVDIIVYGPVADINWRIGLDALAPGSPPSATDEADQSGTQPRKKP